MKVDSEALNMASEFVSVIRPNGEKAAAEGGRGKSYPVLPVRDTVLFPHAVLPLTVGRESSIQDDSGGGAAGCPAGLA
jgi:hypothetical protein